MLFHTLVMLTLRAGFSIVTLLSLMVSTSSHAQDYPSGQITDNSGQGDAAGLSKADVMIVTAPGDSPLVTVTSPKIPRQPVPASDGADYLKTIPGFSQIRNGGTNGDPVLRGMFGSRLRILTDGAEMPGACPSRMDAPTSYISPESYDLLTVIKGPQTVLWGPGASAGVVRFERARPHFDQPDIHLNASAQVGSNRRFDQNIDTLMGSETGFLRLSGNKSTAADYQDGGGNRVPSKWSKWNGDLALGLTPDSDTLLELSMGKGDGDARYAGRGMDGAHFKRDSIGLRYEKNNIGTLFESVEAQLFYRYADHQMDNIDRSGAASPMMSGCTHCVVSRHGMRPMIMNVDRRTVGGRAVASWHWDNYQLQSGIDTQVSVHRKMVQKAYQKDAAFGQTGLFSELTWSEDDYHKVVSGVRADYQSVDNFRAPQSQRRSAILPAGFIRYEHTLEPMPVMLYAGLGYTERYPDYWELFSPTMGPGNASAFDGLKSEKTRQLDIGANYVQGGIKGWVSGWVAQADDFIVFQYAADGSRGSRADNVNAVTLGGEAGLAWSLSEQWTAESSLAYSWGKNRRDGRPLPQMPPLEARLGLRWEKGDWSSTALWRLVSQQQRIALHEGNVVGKDFDSSTGFGILSANISWKATPDVKFSGGIDNIFNKEYHEHLNLAGNSSFGYAAGTPVNEPGRTWWGRISVAL